MNQQSNIVVKVDGVSSFLGVWLTLVKHKFLFILTIVLCILLGFGYVYSKPTIFSYSSAIQIGETTDGERVLPIEHPALVVSKIHAVYRPVAVRQLASTYGGAMLNSIEANNPGNSSLIFLESRGAGEDANAHKELHTAIARMIVDDHSRLFQARNRELARQISTQQHVNNPAFFLRIKIALADKAQTRQVGPMIQSVEPVDAGRRRLLVSIVLLALLAGVFLVFLAEVVEKISYLNRSGSHTTR